MLKSYTLRILFAVVILTGIGLGIYFGYGFWQKKRITQLESQILSQYLEKLKPEQIVGQLFHIGLRGSTLTQKQRTFLKTFCPGGVILFKRNIVDNDQIKKYTTDLQTISSSHCHTPLLISIDQEGGRIQRIDTQSNIPSAMSIGQTQNPEYARQAALITGIEMAALGINLVLAPVLDVNNNPSNPVINTRSFGSDPELVASFGHAYTQGALLAHSGPVLKHFPGHGDTGTDSHLALPSIHSDPGSLVLTELPPFVQSIQSGAPIIMVAHILFPALDDQYPATLSKKIITGLLRNKLGFDKLVMTDALEMKAVADRYRQDKVVSLSLEAGADILLFGDPGLDLLTKIQAELLAKYKVNQSSYISSVRRQLLYKLQNGLLKGEPFKGNELYAQINDYNKLKKFDPNQVLKKVDPKYQNNFRTLSDDICMDSIRALGKDFTPINPADSTVYYKSDQIKKHALHSGFSETSLDPGHLSALRKKIKSATKPLPINTGKKEVLVVELDSNDLGAWNLLVGQTRTNDSLHLLALYTGNPFLKIQTSPSSAVLLNTTNGSNCKTALFSRAFNSPNYSLVPKSLLPGYPKPGN